MSDIISEFAIHVGTGTALGPIAGASHRKEADWREREIRDFIGAMAAELRLVQTNDPERKAIIDALLAAHPKLTGDQTSGNSK